MKSYLRCSCGVFLVVSMTTGYKPGQTGQLVYQIVLAVRKDQFRHCESTGAVRPWRGKPWEAGINNRERPECNSTKVAY